MKNRASLLFVLAALAAVPLAAQQPPAPVITSVTPTQITAYAPGPITFTITGQNLSPAVDAIVNVSLQSTGIDWSTGLTVSSRTNTQIVADLNVVPPSAGTYLINLTVYLGTIQSAQFPITVNPPLSTPEWAYYTAYATVPFREQLPVTAGTPPYTWQIADSVVPPELTLSESGLLTGTFSAPSGPYLINVMVTDASGAHSWTGFELWVEPAPMIITSPRVLPTAYLGQPYMFTFTATGGEPPLFWSAGQGNVTQPFVIPGLTLDTQTGVLSGVPTQTGVFPISISVSSTFGNAGSGRFSLTVMEHPPLTLPAAELPGASVAQAYTYQFTAQGGAPPYSFAGKVPDGLTLGKSGLLTGTPTTQGTTALQLTVTDSAGQTASQVFGLTIGPPAFRITNEILQNGRIGLTYADTLKATGGTTPFTWAVKTGALPAGIALDATTGKLAGSPTKGGLFRLEFQVTDAKNAVASRALTILIVVPPVSITTQSLPDGRLSQPYSATLAADGGEAPLSWTVTGGALPAGLKLDPTGAIAGTPTAKGTFPFVVAVADGSGQKASRTYAIAVTDAPLNITTPSLSTATTGSVYSAMVTAEGGSGAYVWSVAAGALPAGLTLDTGTGAITGTPAIPGEQSITLAVTDATGASASRSYTLRIAPPLLAATVSTENPPAGQQGMAGVVIAKYPVQVTGQLIMTFTPDSGYSDDPAAQFAAGGRTVPITIGAGETNFFSPIQVGTTPGTIRITATFAAAGADVTPKPAPEKTLRIEKTAPVISSVTVTRNTGGFTVTVTGFGTARDITTATFRLASSGGGTLQTSDFTVQVGQAFSSWFGSDGSKQFGGQFRYTQPFTVQGDSNAINSVTVTLTSSAGASQSVSATF